LPKYLKYDFLKETNKSVFNQLPFFMFTMEKTIYNLARNIEMRMSHPEEVIRNTTDDFHLWILKSGEVGLAYCRRGADVNGQIIDKIVVRGNSQPALLSLNFITKKQLPYEIKSLQYSSFYFLEFHKLIASLKESDNDFLHYAYMRDKINNVPDEFEVHPCRICEGRFHYKFDCTAIHHVPNRDKVIYSHLRDNKLGKITKRTSIERDNTTYRAFEVYRHFNLAKEDSSENNVHTYTPSLLAEEHREVILAFANTDWIDEEDTTD
jgi:hypothetical protein